MLLLFCLAGTGCAHETEVDPLQAFQQGDYKSSYAGWLPAAQSGDADAQYYVAMHHYLGLGMRRDMKMAAEWWRKSALQGYPEAQLQYGILHYEGVEVVQSFPEAFVWFTAAAQQGNEQARRQAEALERENKLSFNQIKFGKMKAKEFIFDSEQRSVEQ